ncbi:MAG: GNAT family N-acetyltransferase; N-acetyltransferase [Bryobacteraceae bacterium]
MTPILETTRLILRPLELADADEIQLLFPQWEIVRYLANQVPWPYPSDGAYVFYRDVALPAMASGNAWHWTLRLKSAPERIIGSIGLMKGEDTNRGFWLGAPWQGKGLMSEATEIVTDYWFNILKFSVLRVPKAIVNTASRRISEKHGMRVVAVEERDYVSGRLSTEIWEITANEWNARKRDR